MKRKASLFLSVALIVAYYVKHLGTGDLFSSLAFALPPLATDVVAVALIVRVWRHEPAAQDDTWQAFFGALAAAHLFLIADLVGFTLVDPEPFVPLRMVSGVLLTASYPLAIYTMLVLGRSFSVLPEAKRLVTAGPYKWSRHPLYVLYIFWYVLLVGIGQSAPSLVLAVVSAALQVYRARREERVLSSTFGEDYEAYRARTMWLGRRRAPASASAGDAPADR